MKLTIIFITAFFIGLVEQRRHCANQRCCLFLCYRFCRWT
jgi:hypothetical protein